MFRAAIIIFFLLTSIAHADISLNKAKFFRLDASYEICGSVFVKDRFYVVMDNRAAIYQVSSGQKQTSPKMHINLEALKGYAEYSSRNKVNLEGISYCSNAFYLVNESNNDVLKVTSTNLSALPIDKSYLGTSVSGKNGLEGIAIDCANQMLFVASQSYPQKVVVYYLKDNRYVATFDLSEGIEDKKNNISDLSFEGKELFVLQKNRSSILIIHVYGNVKPVLERVDYSKYAYLFESRDDAGNLVNKDFAEGLVARGQDYFLFYDQGKAGPIAAKGKTFGLDLDFRGVILQLSK